MDVSQPPPLLTAPSALATSVNVPGILQGSGSSHGSHYRSHYHGHGHGQHSSNKSYYKSFNSSGGGSGAGGGGTNSSYQRQFQVAQDDFDGKRLRKSVMRKTVDYNASIVRSLEVCLLISIVIKVN